MRDEINAALTQELDELGWLPYALAANVVKFMRQGNYQAARHFFIELMDLAGRTDSFNKPAAFMVQRQLVLHLTDAEFEAIRRGGASSSPTAAPSWREILTSDMREGDSPLWLWRNGDYFLAFRHEFPCHPGGDPMVLGEPIAGAILRSSVSGRSGSAPEIPSTPDEGAK